ncbi:SDR family NAD(P)-dependent oxidoreductase [Nonomuraea sp. SBT364]|uniref:SDR family NAD(P)-dependent oxidoreductase n=1 Tax=Nonomuraea sp. SBT364 TaxID=1580530 RepID=UPI0007C767B4|nr:glucose 1-dehydrogenase [Nonomuraea sp. SBT364]
MDLTGKSALITGASRGIGRAIALRFAGAGANVALLARSADALEEVAAQAGARGAKTLTLPCDVGSASAIDSAVAEAVDVFGGLDILVNNAGSVGSAGPFLELTDEDWAHVLAVDLTAVNRFLRLFGRHATARGSGSVVNISSVAGERGCPMLSHYAAVKAAMNSLTRTLAAEWAASGVRVNAIQPGWVATDLTASFHADQGASEALMRAVPARRWASPEEIGDGALYLAGDAAAMVTGAILTIDGGMAACNGGPAMIDLLALGRVEMP